MTKFMTLNSVNKEVKNKTVFKQILTEDLNVVNIVTVPSDWDNVLYLGYDGHYGDVFKAWNDGDSCQFTLFFGTKGDEFED